MTRGFALVALGATLWGTGGIAGAIIAANSEMSWPAISGLRLLAGGLLLLGLTALTGELQRIRRGVGAGRRILVTGAGTAVYTTAYFQAVPMVGVAVATVVCLGSAPVAIAVYTAAVARRMPGPGTVIALVAAVAGLALVSDLRGATGSAVELVVGLGLALASGLSFAATTVANRTTIPGLGARALIATSLSVAGLIAAPVGIVVGVDFASMTTPAWAAAAFLVLVQTMVAYVAYFAGLQTGLPSTTAVIVLLIEPLIATILAVVILDETLTASIAAGIALLMLAIILVRPAGPDEPVDSSHRDISEFR